MEIYKPIKNIDQFERELINLIENVDINCSDKVCAQATRILMDAGISRLFCMAGHTNQGLACHSVMSLMQVHLEYLNDINFRNEGKHATN